MVALSKGASVVGLLSFGTLTSLFSKIVYELQGEGLDGEQHFFRKPWFMTTLMFMGMSFCLPLAYLEERQNTARIAAEATAANEPLLGIEIHGGEPGTTSSNGQERSDAKAKRPEWQDALMLAIPTVFDLIATVLMNIGLLSVTASVYQMMRGAEMLFAALFAVLFLARKLNRLHFSGIGCCVVGITLVGLSSVLSGQGGTAVPVTQAQIILGMGLIVLSQAVQAAQITFEDYFMSEMDMSPMKIVGYEGVIGASLMAFVLLPLVHFLPGAEGAGIHEDTLDSLHMIASNPRLAAVLAVQMLGLLSYNYMGMHVTGHLGAVFRTVLETMRTLFVWLVGLVLFYTGSGLGESWDAYSVIQAAGFCVLVVGTVVYGRGDERAASLAVDEFIAQTEAEEGDIEDPIPDPMAPATIPKPMPVRRVGGSMTGSLVMPSPSLRANASLAANSYQEAFASSLRNRGFSVE